MKIISIFVSDLHLGSKHSLSKLFFNFIHDKEPENLIIIGDFIDSFKMNGSWKFKKHNWLIFHKIISLLISGKTVVWLRGNHENMDHFPSNQKAWGGLIFGDEYVHTTKDNKKLLCIHSHQFDVAVSTKNGKILMKLGSLAYDFLLFINHYWAKCLSKLRIPYFSISKIIKKSSKVAVQYISSFEEELKKYAIAKGCNGVIWGHLHTPFLKIEEGFINANTGSWIDDDIGSALIEYEDGSLELVKFNYLDHN